MYWPREGSPAFLVDLRYYAGLSKMTAGAFEALFTVPWTLVPVTVMGLPADGGSGCCPELRKRTVLPLASDFMSTFVMIVSAICEFLLCGA
jgi:hypothetical protein